MQLLLSSELCPKPKPYAFKDQVVYNKPLSYRVLRNHVQALERELNSDSEFQKLLAGIEFGGEDSSRLCWAGKVLDRSKGFCDYIGSNERTKEMARSIWMNATAHKEGCR